MRALSATLRHGIEARLGLRNAAWRARGTSAWASTWTLAGGGRRFFAKVATDAAMLASEADGLAALADTRTVRVPAVLACEREDDTACLVLEWLDVTARPPSHTLGRAIAHLHRAAVPHGPRGERYGWHDDNFLGATPQANAWCDDWCAFFRTRRLEPQLARLEARGFGELAREGTRLLEALPSLLAHDPAPSLLHGDLWSGNAAMLASGEGAVFDPAVYVGDREADIAMTALFGGFGEDFLRGYESVWPLDDAFASRRAVYDLYHLLNHVNLFGDAYVARTRRTLSQLREAAGY